MKILQKTYLFLSLLSASACEPDIQTELLPLKKQVVVDGWIEQGNFAYVFLTYNTPYFSNLDSASFRALVATYAKVTISDGENSEILTLMRDTNYFPPVFYRGTELKGKVGKTYSLIIVDNLDTITASTTINQPVVLDSIWFEFNSKGDSMGIVKGTFTDNVNVKNYYRTFTKIKNVNKVFVPTLISNFDDKYFNGERFTFSLKKGPETYLKPVKNIYYSRGDSIQVKITSIDEKSFKFWVNYQDEVINSGNPFAASHKKVTSNINGGLGIWCGYGSSYYLVIAK